MTPEERMRERCAQVCDDNHFAACILTAALDPETNGPMYDEKMLSFVRGALEDCIQKIRALPLESDGILMGPNSAKPDGTDPGAL